MFPENISGKKKYYYINERGTVRINSPPNIGTTEGERPKKPE
jgi:hypothetical protein